MRLPHVSVALSAAVDADPSHKFSVIGRQPQG
jgi:hypothetical protein